MPVRKTPLVKNELYHVYNSSIAGFKIFNCDKDYERMVDEMIFYMSEKPPCNFSQFKKIKEKMRSEKYFQFDFSKKTIDIIAYCIMPTHIHFILKELKDSGIANFMNLISHSYSKYFNPRYNRKGPLWEGRFKNVLVESDYQFMHLNRYIHLNPITARLVNKPTDWKYSSYNEYIGLIKEKEKICNFSDYLSPDIPSYEKFVNDQIDYQRALALIKHLTFE
jgi:putative transposase